jgi:hypothetical protein
VVSTEDFESSNLGSNPSATIKKFQVIIWNFFISIHSILSKSLLFIY